MAENTNDKCDILGVSQASRWFLRIALQHNSSTLAHTYWVRPSLWLQATEKMRRLQPTVIILNLSCPMLLQATTPQNKSQNSPFV